MAPLLEHMETRLCKCEKKKRRGDKSSSVYPTHFFTKSTNAHNFFIRLNLYYYLTAPLVWKVPATVIILTHARAPHTLHTHTHTHTHNRNSIAFISGLTHLSLIGSKCRYLKWS